MMRHVAVAGATRALRCPDWLEIRVDERTDKASLRAWQVRPCQVKSSIQYDTSGRVQCSRELRMPTACNRLEAAGEPVDRKGDHQANIGEFNRRHNHGPRLRALHDMVAAVALGPPLVLGDKEQPWKTA
eukprot:5480988-Prymnesium_polylepis.1